MTILVPPPIRALLLRQRLLGRMDLDTREWFDGVLTAAARKVVKEPPEASFVPVLC